ncbi:MAG: phosphohistidine phosphatase SixA [Bacteroidetes bacterium]|nr:phosphohistidine phosphatase SixA [Bacteroidota bacterium]
MNLYIVRHAEALPVGGIIARDAERKLSPRGGEDAALMGRALAHLDPNLEIIVTSPLRRAIETGEIMGKEISDHPTMRVSEHLAPGLNARALLRELLALSAGSSIAVVGHQPDMSNFISYLITGGQEASVAMSAGAVAKLILEDSRHRAYLGWLLTPDAVKVLFTGL